MATLRPIGASEHKLSSGEDFYVKNKRLSRPVSPHLTIYKPQLTAMLSITHRGTGCFNSALLSGFAVAAVAMPGNFGMCLEALNAAAYGPAVIFATKWILAWPFCFHMLNGVRHLAWDMGMGFQMSDLYKTGWTVTALSLALATGLALM